MTENRVDYLVAGASHAALAALEAIRMHDSQGSVAVASREAHSPYSPTVLPYVVSGRSQPAAVALKSADYFARNHIDFLAGRALARVDGAAKRVHFANGEALAYGKLLLATGAAPIIPPIPGLGDVEFHVLRTLDDATRLNAALPKTKAAVVLGAGLIGMHAAENLAKTGAAVTVVEMQPQVLPGYFDGQAGEIIAAVFAEKGVRLVLGSRVERLAKTAQGCTLTLADGSAIAADLLLVATGVAPVMDYLAGSGVATERGVLVDDAMRSNVEGIYAAGDVAQAKGFYSGKALVGGILPDAVEQGRIAGMAMAGDPATPAYPGSIPLNTYAFFGSQALSVGSQSEGEVVCLEVDAGARRYLKIVMQEGRLTGIFGINRPFDAGIMWQLILRRTDLGPLRARFIAQPQQTARQLMSKLWR